MATITDRDFVFVGYGPEDEEHFRKLFSGAVRRRVDKRDTEEVARATVRASLLAAAVESDDAVTRARLQAQLAIFDRLFQ